MSFISVSLKEFDALVNSSGTARRKFKSNQPLPKKLEGDEIRLKQILINLVKNALKFSDENGTIKLVSTFDVQNEMLKLHIIDNGKGIRKEDIDKLFKMFGKLRRTAEINNEGIGLGLMICENLVKMNHGTISVHSDGEN